MDFFATARSMRLATVEVAKIAPINTISKDGVIVFLPEATAEERAAAQAILDNWVDPPQQNWKAFVDEAAEVSGFYGAIAGSAMASLITARMVRLAGGEEFKGASDPLISSWNAAPPDLDQTQRDELTALATTHNIPVTIDDSDNTLAAA